MNTGCGPLAEAGGFSFARPRVAASVALMRCERWGREVWRGCCEEGVDDFRDAVEAVEDLQAEANGLGFLFWGHGGVQPGLMKTRAPRDVRARGKSNRDLRWQCGAVGGIETAWESISRLPHLRRGGF